MVNKGPVDTGSGSDSIERSKKQDGEGVNGFGIYNAAFIAKGSSNDAIRGTGPDAGIFSNGSTAIGSGADSIKGVANGVGGIEQEGQASVTTGAMIDTHGIIHQAAVRDTVKGEGDSLSINSNCHITGSTGNDFN